MNGTVTRDPGGRTATLRFERRLAHAPELVWRVLTDARELAYWFPARIDGAREAGAALRFAFDARPAGVADDTLAAWIAEKQAAASAAPASVFEGRMQIFDPPRTLAFDWDGDHLRFELSPVPGGTLLVFTHTLAEPGHAANTAAGWHISLDWLEARLHGQLLYSSRARLEALEAQYERLAPPPTR